MNKQLNSQIFHDNLVQRKMKEDAIAKEKAADKQMIDSLVERERMLAQLEADAKERYKQETRDFLKNYKNRTNELAHDQDYLDKLLEEERNKQWKKRQDQWDKEEKARVNLLYDVYGNRADALKYKANQRDQLLQAKEMEKMKLTSTINQFQTEQRQKELNEILVSCSSIEFGV